MYIVKHKTENFQLCIIDPKNFKLIEPESNSDNSIGDFLITNVDYSPNEVLYPKIVYVDNNYKILDINHLLNNCFDDVYLICQNDKFESVIDFDFLNNSVKIYNIDQQNNILPSENSEKLQEIFGYKCVSKINYSHKRLIEELGELIMQRYDNILLEINTYNIKIDRHNIYFYENNKFKSYVENIKHIYQENLKNGKINDLVFNVNIYEFDFNEIEFSLDRKFINRCQKWLMKQNCSVKHLNTSHAILQSACLQTFEKDSILDIKASLIEIAFSSKLPPDKAPLKLKEFELLKDVKYLIWNDN